MEYFPFKPFSPGVRTLWVLQFKGQTPEEENKRPRLPVDLFIPSPFANEWFNTSATTQNQKALEYLDEIQKTCKEIKQEAKITEKFETLEDYLKKANDLFKNLDSLDDLMKNYTDFLKRYYSSPPDKKNPDKPEEHPKEQI